MKIFIVGSLNMDLVIHAPYMPENGVTLAGSGFMTNPGGKGANQAAAVGKLGGNAYMVGCVGETFGRDLTDALESYRVHIDTVQKVEGSSGIAVIVVVDGDNRIFLDAGANGKVDAAAIDAALGTAAPGDYLIAQLEIGMDCVAYALKRAKEKGMTTFLNPAPAATLPDAVYGYCDYFIPNQSETEFYTGLRPDSEEHIAECAAMLKSRGCRNVLITLGTRGSVCVTEDGRTVRVPCEKAKAVDTTAAGDTYVGALAVRLSEGADIETAMRFAGKASAITVTRRGAQQSIPWRKEISE